jgi:glycogen(starch) synthase
VDALTPPAGDAGARILTIGNMYPPHHFGGYELIWRSWVQHAESRGHAVRVLTTDFRLDPEPIEDQQEAGDVHRELRWYWHDHEFPRLGLGERWSIERHNARVLDRHLQHFRPDVVVWWAMAGMSMSAIERVRRAGIPAVGFLDDYWLEYGPSVDAWTRVFRDRPRLARLVERTTGMITRADLVTGISFIFSSQILLEGARGAWPTLTDAEVVPHAPPEIEIFTEAPPGAWSWKLLYIGRIDEAKGIDLAILALLSLPEQATLTVVGTGNEDYRRELQRLVHTHRLEDRVSFARRPRAELPAVYAQADAVLFPVRWNEPFGIVPLEAMAVGRPVVATGKGGSGEFLSDQENCLIFDPTDGAGELAKRVRVLADDPSLRDRLRQGGRRTVDEIRGMRFNERVLATALRAREDGSS